ncbi:gene transfer agent family protein [Rhizobium sp. SGZ-381]|uniref:gene transfer agent family protein n=1 Tax=Rhizobium sp. SGZ-381 TaxID=3342800 RepID=UPI00366C649E
MGATFSGGVLGRANRRRGEIEAVIDGERRILCLTLAALAELETAFAVDDLTGLAMRFAEGRLKALDLARIIGAGLRGGGNLLSDEDVAAMSIEGGVPAYARVVADLLAATFGGEDDPVSSASGASEVRRASEQPAADAAGARGVGANP